MFPENLMALKAEQVALAKEIQELSAQSSLPQLSVARLQRKLKEVQRSIAMIEGSFFPDTVA